LGSKLSGPFVRRIVVRAYKHSADVKTMILLQVPFNEKEEAKALGARWDAKKKKWFVPEGMDASKFEKWTPDYEKEFSIKAISPFYLVKSKEPCWKCEKISEVITFAAEGVIEDDKEHKEFVTFVYVSLLPEKLATFIAKKYENYFIDFSKTTQSYYYINHCMHCSALLGDFYLHSEPDGAFFPMSEQAAKEIELIELKESGYIQLSADTAYGYPSMIGEFASKIKHKP